MDIKIRTNEYLTKQSIVWKILVYINIVENKYGSKIPPKENRTLKGNAQKRYEKKLYNLCYKKILFFMFRSIYYESFLFCTLQWMYFNEYNR